MSKRNSIRRKPQPLQPVDANQRYEIFEGQQYLRLAQSTIYKKIKAGELRIIRDGGRIYLPGTEIIRLSTLTGAAA